MPVRTYDVVIDLCHADIDREFARLLGVDLGNAGATVRMHESECREEDRTGDREWRPRVYAGYRIVVLSPAAVAAEWVKEALSRGLAPGITGRRVTVLIAVRTACRLPELPSAARIVDFTDEQGYESAFEDLLEAIRESEDAPLRTGEDDPVESYPTSITVDPLPGYPPHLISLFCRYFENFHKWPNETVDEKDEQILTDAGLIEFHEYYDYGQWGYEFTWPGCRLVDRIYGRRIRPCPRGYVEDPPKAMNYGKG